MLSDLLYLERPLVLIESEQIKVCQGHKESFGKFKKRSQAKEEGSVWLEEIKKNSSIKFASYEIEKKSKKEKKLIKCFTHVNDIILCDHYKIETIRKLFRLETMHTDIKVPVS